MSEEGDEHYASVADQQADKNISRQAKLTIYLIGVWTAICFTLATTLRAYHADLPAFGFLISGIGGALFAAWMYVKYEYRESRQPFAASMTIFSQLNVVLAIVALGATYIELFPPTFRLVGYSEIQQPFLTDLRKPTTVSLIVPWRTTDANGVDLYSINVFFETDIANLLPTSRHFEGYWLETEVFPSVWRRLCEVDTSKGKLLFLASRERGFPIKLDLLSTRLGKGLGANDSVIGWTAWQCPDTDCRLLRMRLVLKTTDGKVEYLSLEKSKNGSPEKFAGHGTLPFGPSQEIELPRPTVIPATYCNGQPVP